MKLFKAVYSRGFKYVFANSQEEAKFQVQSWTEDLGILKTIYEVEE